jgi:hypothetical protein
MPIVRIQKPGDAESEGLGGTKPTTPSLGVGTGELSRITTNLALSDHVGKFIAGEVTSHFKNENLADMLKGKNMIMISGSWG